MARSPALFICSVCLPAFLLSLPVHFSHQDGIVREKRAAISASQSLSAATCPRNTPEENSGAGAVPSLAGNLMPDECNDPIDKCKKPIKYLGSKGACACFACEYGQSTQHNVCTQNKKDKQTLLAASTSE
jgi:hypothetical protein